MYGMVNKAVEEMVCSHYGDDTWVEASRLKSDFLANMSHEIRTPLNSIIGVAEMLAATPLNDQQREFAHIIFESGKALLALISDILDFSKIEAGKLLIEQHPFELNRCIESALDQVSTTAQEKGLELAYLIEEPVPHQVVGDETRLRQILINLLGNAVKFTQHGEVTLTVSAYMLEDPSDTYELLFVVHDSGIGIPPERQERLFQPFSQVDASTTRKYGGTGLGLAISQRLCEAMGGQMWVESVGIAGKGADFCFTLPLAEALLVPPAVHDAGDVLRHKHLVLVLGNCGAAAQWRSLAVQAQLWGMEARFCSSLDELAAWRAAGKPVDVAVIDQRSVSATHELAGADVPELAGLRWVILAPLGHREPVSGITIAGHVSKPVKSAQWKHALMQALDGTPRPVNAKSELENLFDPGFAQHIPRHILVVEDNPVNQIVIRRLLERLGYATDIADCGQNALTAIHERAYDLIFMDMQMPDMDGLETSRRIRQLERTAKPARPQATIVALTANVQPEDRAACLAAGMDDYVSKPIQITELRQVIARTAHKSAVIRQ